MEILTRKQASDLGLKRYFNGIACANGHIADRLVSNATCVLCAKARGAKHYQDNKEIYIDRAKKYYAENTPEVKKRISLWASRNPEKIKGYTTEYRRANRKACNARIAKWEAANPEARRVINQNRRARKRANGGRLSPGLASKLFKLQRGKCACCGKPLGTDYHLDHIMPLALGGQNADSNMQLLTATCNLQKRAKHPVDFMQQRGKLI